MAFKDFDWSFSVSVDAGMPHRQMQPILHQFAERWNHLLFPPPTDIPPEDGSESDPSLHELARVSSYCAQKFSDAPQTDKVAPLVVLGGNLTTMVNEIISRTLLHEVNNGSPHVYWRVIAGGSMGSPDLELTWSFGETGRHRFRDPTGCSGDQDDFDHGSS
jgi:hypothetical protein